MKIVSAILCFCILTATAQICLAQAKFKVKTVTGNGKKVKEEGASLRFSENSVSAVKGKRIIKEFKYSDIVEAEYSYSKKPYLSKTQAVAATIFLSYLAVPLFFLTKKKRWLSIRTSDDFLIMRMSGNYKRIITQLESRKIGVRVTDEEDATVAN